MNIYLQNGNEYANQHDAPSHLSDMKADDSPDPLSQAIHHSHTSEQDNLSCPQRYAPFPGNEQSPDKYKKSACMAYNFATKI